LRLRLIERLERSTAVERLERAAVLGQNVLNEAKRLNVWNDWNGSLPTVNSIFSTPKIWLFSDLSKYAGHFACRATFQTFQKPALSPIEGFHRYAPFKSFKTIRIWRAVPRFGNFSKRETIESRELGEASERLT
jgi:hypothetical protein